MNSTKTIPEQSPAQPQEAGDVDPLTEWMMAQSPRAPSPPTPDIAVNDKVSARIAYLTAHMSMPEYHAKTAEQKQRIEEEIQFWEVRSGYSRSSYKFVFH